MWSMKYGGTICQVPMKGSFLGFRLVGLLFEGKRPSILPCAHQCLPHCKWCCQILHLVPSSLQLREAGGTDMWFSFFRWCWDNGSLLLCLYSTIWVKLTDLITKAWAGTPWGILTPAMASPHGRAPCAVLGAPAFRSVLPNWVQAFLTGRISQRWLTSSEHPLCF